jgi:hypothetical protein
MESVLLFAAIHILCSHRGHAVECLQTSPGEAFHHLAMVATKRRR